MPVNSVSPIPTVQSQDAVKKTGVAAARRQSEVQDDNKVNAQKQAADRQVQIQKSQESSKPSVNTNGQKVGTRINTAA